MLMCKRGACKHDVYGKIAHFRLKRRRMYSSVFIMLLPFFIFLPAEKFLQKSFRWSKLTHEGR